MYNRRSHTTQPSTDDTEGEVSYQSEYGQSSFHPEQPGGLPHRIGQRVPGDRNHAPLDQLATIDDSTENMVPRHSTNAPPKLEQRRYYDTKPVPKIPLEDSTNKHEHHDDETHGSHLHTTDHHPLQYANENQDEEPFENKAESKLRSFASSAGAVGAAALGSLFGLGGNATASEDAGDNHESVDSASRYKYDGSSHFDKDVSLNFETPDQHHPNLPESQEAGRNLLNPVVQSYGESENPSSHHDNDQGLSGNQSAMTGYPLDKDYVNFNDLYHGKEETSQPPSDISEQRYDLSTSHHGEFERPARVIDDGLNKPTGRRTSTGIDNSFSLPQTHHVPKNHHDSTLGVLKKDSVGADLSAQDTTPSDNVSNPLRDVSNAIDVTKPGGDEAEAEIVDYDPIPDNLEPTHYYDASASHEEHEETFSSPHQGPDQDSAQLRKSSADDAKNGGQEDNSDVNVFTLADQIVHEGTPSTHRNDEDHSGKASRHSHRSHHHLFDESGEAIKHLAKEASDGVHAAVASVENTLGIHSPGKLHHETEHSGKSQPSSQPEHNIDYNEAPVQNRNIGHPESEDTTVEYTKLPDSSQHVTNVGRGSEDFNEPHQHKPPPQVPPRKSGSKDSGESPQHKPPPEIPLRNYSSKNSGESNQNQTPPQVPPRKSLQTQLQTDPHLVNENLSDSASPSHAADVNNPTRSSGTLSGIQETVRNIYDYVKNNSNLHDTVGTHDDDRMFAGFTKAATSLGTAGGALFEVTNAASNADVIPSDDYPTSRRSSNEHSSDSKPESVHSHDQPKEHKGDNNVERMFAGITKAASSLGHSINDTLKSEFEHHNNQTEEKDSDSYAGFTRAAASLGNAGGAIFGGVNDAVKSEFEHNNNQTEEKNSDSYAGFTRAAASLGNAGGAIFGGVNDAMKSEFEHYNNHTEMKDSDSYTGFTRAAASLVNAGSALFGSSDTAPKADVNPSNNEGSNTRSDIGTLSNQPLDNRFVVGNNETDSDLEQTDTSKLNLSKPTKSSTADVSITQAKLNKVTSAPPSTHDANYTQPSSKLNESTGASGGYKSRTHSQPDTSTGSTHGAPHYDKVVQVDNQQHTYHQDRSNAESHNPFLGEATSYKKQGQAKTATGGSSGEQGKSGSKLTGTETLDGEELFF